MASPKEPRNEVLSLTRNVPGSLSLSSWIAVRAQAGAQPNTAGETSPRCALVLCRDSLLGSSRKSCGACAKHMHIHCVAPAAASLQGPGLVPQVPAAPRTLNPCPGHAV